MFDRSARPPPLGLPWGLPSSEDLRIIDFIACPVLVLWGQTVGTSRSRCLEAWKQWADDVTGGGLECGHFLPEEAPEALLAHLEPFLEHALLQ